MNISVIIPTFNRASVLARALDSVMAQTEAPAEVIVVDDGSTDSTLELIRDRYAGVRYFRQENRGVSAARNRGVAQALGDWIAFLDSDDAWLPGKLEAQRRALEEHPEHRLCHTEEMWIRRGRRVNQKRKHRKSGGSIFRNCLPLCVISPSSALIHRSLLAEVGVFDEDLPACEDYDLWLRICARVPVLFVEKPQILKYGGHPDQLSRRYWGMDRFRVQALDKIIRSARLSAADRQAAIDALISKTEILIQGAEKRERVAIAKHFRAIQQAYRLQSVTALRPAPVPH